MKISIVIDNDDGSQHVQADIETSQIVELVSHGPIILDVDEGHETVRIQFQAKNGEVEVIREPDNNLVTVQQATAVPA